MRHPEAIGLVDEKHVAPDEPMGHGGENRNATAKPRAIRRPQFPAAQRRRSLSAAFRPFHRGFRALEADFAVGTIAKGLVHRTAASA